MLKNRLLLENHIEKQCLNIAIDNALSNRVYECAKDKYKINKGLTSDLICLRISLSEVSEFVLFCVLDCIETETNCKSIISEFFTKQEIDTYSKSFYNIKSVKFPLKFKMIQVSFDQWIGKIDIDTLMTLRNAQLINYNVNAQRTMKRVINNNKEIYKITLNESSIKSISEMYKSNAYIPTTLTLNIPEEAEVDFSYDKDNNELIINSLDHFDITDGYHRYISACRCFDDMTDFNYEMELRIVNFSLNKANMFIYQEDQKTKMKKIDSGSFNLNSCANIVVEKINQNPMFNLKGKISRNEGLINYGELSELVNFFYFKEASKDNKQVKIISASKELISGFNTLTEFDTNFLYYKYNYKELFILLYIFNNYQHLNISEMCELIKNSLNNIDKLNNKKFLSKIPRKSALNEISILVEECFAIVQRRN